MNAQILFDNAFDNGMLNDEYMEYIMEHGSKYGLNICNGDMLIDAFERGVLFEEFRDHWNNARMIC